MVVRPLHYPEPILPERGVSRDAIIATLPDRMARSNINSGPAATCPSVSYLPVFTRVHNRLMTRWVGASRAVITNSFAIVASSG